MYQKNFFQDKWPILGPKMTHPHNSGLALRMFLKFCQMKVANSYMKILFVVFREKIYLGQFDLFALRPLTVWLGIVKLSQATVNWILKQSGHDFFMITTGSLNSQYMISQVNIYVIDIVWILCDVYVWRSKFMVL